MDETMFPTGDLTMISIDLDDKIRDLRDLIKEIEGIDFPKTILFPNKGEVIANLTLAIRSMEDSQSRIARSRQYIIDCSKKSCF